MSNDVSGSRRNSDIGTFLPPQVDSRRNSESTYRRNSEFIHIKPLIINRRSSDISIRTLDRSPSHFQCIIPPVKIETQEKSESDSDQPDQPDCSEKAALMDEKAKDKEEETKIRKKNLSWKTDKNMEDPEDITAEANLLPENIPDAGVMVRCLLLHSIQRTKTSKARPDP